MTVQTVLVKLCNTAIIKPTKTKNKTNKKNVPVLLFSCLAGYSNRRDLKKKHHMDLAKEIFKYLVARVGLG